MFRISIAALNSTLRHSVLRNAIHKPTAVVMANRTMSHGKTETDQEFDDRYENYFNRKDIDGWEVRKGMNDLCGMDLIPEPRIIIAAMKACRRINDYALCVRFLEGLKFKCGGKVNEIYPYILKEIQPTLTELGISTPEEMGYDKPELYLKSVYD